MIIVYGQVVLTCSYLMDVLDVSFMKFYGKLVRVFYGIHVTW